MKKILIMNIGTELGGIERSLIDLLNFLSPQENFQIDLALWKKRGPMFSEIPSNIHVIENIGVGSFRDIKKQKGIKRAKSYIRYFLFKIASLWGRGHKVIPKIKKKYDIAISFCHNGYSPYYIIDRVEANKKYMWYHHGSYEKTGKEKEQDEKYYQKYNKIITVSNANKLMLQQHFPGVQIEVIANFINEEKILRLANEHIDIFGSFEGLKITTVGRVVKEKGQVFSLEVAKELKNRGIDFRWIFVGDGDQRELCESLVEQYGLQGQCLFVGGKENPYPYIKQADLYVQTSFVESECIAVKEAILLNRRILVLDLPAIQETLGYGKYGDVCIPQAETIAARISRNRKEGKVDYFGEAVISRGNKEIREGIIRLLKE